MTLDDNKQIEQMTDMRRDAHKNKVISYGGFTLGTFLTLAAVIEAVFLIIKSCRS